LSVNHVLIHGVAYVLTPDTQGSPLPMVPNRGGRDAVYEAVINLVEARLSKAKSLKKRR